MGNIKIFIGNRIVPTYFNRNGSWRINLHSISYINYSLDYSKGYIWLIVKRIWKNIQELWNWETNKREKYIELPNYLLIQEQKFFQVLGKR